MAVIKRYPNRKLYNFETKQYTTLAEVSELIQAGQQIQVIDHQSGKDLTTQTLTQIILEHEKSKDGIYSKTLLEMLIRGSHPFEDGEEAQILVSSAINRLINNEIKLRLQSLVLNGSLSQSEADSLVQKLVSEIPGFSQASSEHTQAILLTYDEFETCFNQFEFPSQADINTLNSQLVELYEKLESLSGEICGTEWR